MPRVKHRRTTDAEAEPFSALVTGAKPLFRVTSTRLFVEPVFPLLVFLVPLLESPDVAVVGLDLVLVLELVVVGEDPLDLHAFLDGGNTDREGLHGYLWDPPDSEFGSSHASNTPVWLG